MYYKICWWSCWPPTSPWRSLSVGSQENLCCRVCKCTVYLLFFELILFWHIYQNTFQTQIHFSLFISLFLNSTKGTAFKKKIKKSASVSAGLAPTVIFRLPLPLLFVTLAWGEPQTVSDYPSFLISWWYAYIEHSPKNKHKNEGKYFVRCCQNALMCSMDIKTNIFSRERWGNISILATSQWCKKMYLLSHVFLRSWKLH